MTKKAEEAWAAKEMQLVLGCFPLQTGNSTSRKTRTDNGKLRYGNIKYVEGEG